MAVTFIKRITGATNNLVYLETSDTTATATASGYLTAQATNIDNLNEGVWTWETNDCIMLSASDGISWCSINSTFTTLVPFSGFGVSAVTFSGTLVSGDIPEFSGTSGDIIDSGFAAANVMLKNASNVMAAGANVITDKATATTTGGAATINKQSGVLTTPALTTASGAAYTITLTNSEIATTSIILCQIQGGSNTTPGITIIATPGAGSATILLENSGVAAAALNGTVILSFVVL
jgi:hypothetical protein